MRRVLSCVLLALAACAALLPGSSAAITSYQVLEQQQSASGWSFQLAPSPGSAPGPHGADIQRLQCDVSFETAQRLRVLIFDPNVARYEVPETVLPYPAADPAVALDALDFKFTFDVDPFTLTVVRVSDGRTLLATAPQLVFEDQYIELGLVYDASATVMGLGERVRALALDHNRTYTLWNIDAGTPVDQNLYGSHPFYLEVDAASGAAHGAFMRNSNGMDVQLTDAGRMTWRMIGGIVDLTVFAGPTPAAVVQQYHAVIGTPHMPPLWALGWHQCRWGYANLAAVQDVVAQYAAHHIPLETMWTDIDYMDNYLDFTWDPVKFPRDQFAAFVDALHARNQHFVVIVDPGISNTSGYAAYEQGRVQGVFIQRSAAAGGGEFHGRVWPGFTAFPDWFAPNASAWWRDQVAAFLKGVEYDGLWIDMNEISNFCTGSCDPRRARVSANARAGFDPLNPPFAIDNMDRNQNHHVPLNGFTIDADCPHGNDPRLIEYNTHNLFGMMEGMATAAALEQVTGKRSLVISRSTFAGAGHHNGHWLGDNDATWDSMRQSIAGVLAMNLFGIPLVGADVCGFNGDTTEELCARWSALGAFYPFSRNHNAIGRIPQEPYRWASVAAVSRLVLGARYSLVSYLSTLFFEAHVAGGAVARALVLEFPADAATHALDQQFMLGAALLVSPALAAGVTAVRAYLPPAADWFDFWTLTKVPASGWLDLPAPLSSINVHLRAGRIVARHPAAATRPFDPAHPLTIADVRAMPLELLVVLARGDAGASGSLFLDSGTEVAVGANAVRVEFACIPAETVNATTGAIAAAASARTHSLASMPRVFGAPDAVTLGAVIEQILILNAGAPATAKATMAVNGRAWTNVTVGANGAVVVGGLALLVRDAFTVTWN